LSKEKESQTHVVALRNENMPIWSNHYIKAATSNNTRRAYQADIRHFEHWGGLLPTHTEAIIAYLQAFAPQLNSRTLSRRLTALKQWHIYQGFVDPTVHPAISKTLAGITRTHGKPKDKAPPLLPEQLQRIIEQLAKENTLRALRDSAVLQLGYFGAFRRSELVSIQYEHIQWREKGIEILIPHSKTDQNNVGQFCAIPYGSTLLCPIRALKMWLEKAALQSGYIFCLIKKNSIANDQPLHPIAINHIIKRCAVKAGIEYANELSSHSLRRGLATSACRDGASIPAIMRQGRWKNVNTVMEYIEAAQRFEDNAADHILKKINHEKLEIM
jgi:integrase